FAGGASPGASTPPELPSSGGGAPSTGKLPSGWPSSVPTVKSPRMLVHPPSDATSPNTTANAALILILPSPAQPQPRPTEATIRPHVIPREPYHRTRRSAFLRMGVDRADSLRGRLDPRLARETK